MAIATTQRRLRDSPMTAHVVNRSVAEKTLARQFAEQERGERSPARAAAFERFRAVGLPTRRVEAWHYTDLRASIADAAPIQPAPTRADVEAARARLARRERFAPGAQLVLMGGRFIAELSDPLPANVFIREGVATNAIDDALAALNEALSPAGARFRSQGGQSSSSRSRFCTSAMRLPLTPSIHGRLSSSGWKRTPRSLRYSKAPTRGSASSSDDHDLGRGGRGATRRGRWRRAWASYRDTNLRTREERGANRLWVGFRRGAYASSGFCQDDRKGSQGFTWWIGAHRRRPARRHDAAGRSCRSGWEES